MEGVEPSPKQDRSGEGMKMSLLLDEYIEPPQYKQGDIVEGVIALATSKSILIDIGGKCDAVVNTREVERMSSSQLRDLKPGQVVHAYVMGMAGDDGVILVSLDRAAQYSDWTKARKLMEDGETLALDVQDVNKGGALVQFGRLRGFVPGSQLLPKWRTLQNTEEPERRWEALIGECLTLRIIEVTPDRNRLILSERATVDNKSRKRAILKKLEIGSVVEGVVSNLAHFGAFVNVKGVDGLVHISELCWRRVSHPSEVVQIGDKVKVYILDINLDRERLGLSLKRLDPDPWENITNDYDEGQLVEVQVVNMASFGAFAALVDRPGVEGLIHVSELSGQSIERPEEVVKLGEYHTVRIISINAEDRRIAFSLKQLGDDAQASSEYAEQEMDDGQTKEDNKVNEVE
jgi:small subunit ribosomal protein S1